MSLQNIARTGAVFLDGDAHQRVTATRDKSSPDYRQVRQVLDRLKAENQLADDVYTLEPVSDTLTRFIVITNDLTGIGEEYRLSPETMPLVHRVLREGISVYSPMYMNEHGRWLTAFAPIRDGQGKVVAVLDVDYRADVFWRELRAIRWRILGFSVAGALVALVAGLWYARRIARPLEGMAVQAREVAQGEFSRRLPVTGAQEVADLAGTLNRMAAQLQALAIEQARLFAATERAAREARSLYEVAHSLTTSLDVAEVLHLIAVKTTELLGTPHAQVVLWDEAAQTLRLGAAYGTEAQRVQAQEFRLGEGVNGIVAQTRAPLIVNDYRTFPHRVPWLSELVAVIGVPLLYRDRLLGVLTSHATQPGSPFTEEHLALLTNFADQASAAIENARLYEEERRRALELQTVMEVSRDVVGQGPLDAFLQDVVRRAINITRAQSGTLYLWDGKAEVLCPRAWVNVGDYMRDVCYPLGRGITGTAAAKGRGVIWNEYASHPHRDPELLQHVALMACMAAPLRIRDQLIGVLTLNADEPGRHFSPADLALLETFASQMAVAIENSRLYEEKRLAAIQLEATVEDRTRDLKEAMRQVEEASRHKSEFLATMSHELRTPLNSVIGFSELLLGQGVGPLTEKQARYLGHIHNSGKHLLQLISDILDLSKVEAGKFVLQPEPLPVAQTLEDILLIARGLANKKSQALESQIEPDLPPLHVDPVRFKQILFNLLSNAVKFTPDGGMIALRARRVPGIAEHPQGTRLRYAELPATDRLPQSAIRNPQSEIGECLEIRVTDTGAGIRAEDLPKLFGEFVQLENTRDQRHEGSGLGLALTKKLVELHGGQIRAESDGVGRGSTFAVVLPLATPEG
ncbi:MAG: GAF domain-containing protein [candidate division NC10 bacterium]|nr:GAF domain-containing protein [candidate division NC10 bacterium]